MHVAIEYVLRSRRAERLLTLPCSLFLVNPEKRKLVITLQKYEAEKIKVSHHRMWKCDAHDIFPPSKDSIIRRDEIFTHPDVIVPNFKLLEFQQQPFDADEKQVSELPLAVIQERQYKERLEAFFNPKIMSREREDWLWKCFNKIHVGKDVRGDSSIKNYYNYARPDFQRDFICRKYRAIYKFWEFWKSRLLLDTNPSAELVFGGYYQSEFLSPPTTEESAFHLIDYVPDEF